MPSQTGSVSLATTPDELANAEDRDTHARNRRLLEKAKSGAAFSPEELRIVSDMGPESASIAAYLPIGQQDAIREQFSRRQGTSGGWDSESNADAAVGAFDAGLQRYRQEAFREWVANGGQSPLPPGVDGQGGGTGLSPDALQSLLTDKAAREAEGLQGEQPGLDAYQEDAVLDQGPQTSFLDKLKGEGAFYDESIEGMDLTEYEAAKQERTNTTGREAQERSLADYDATIAEQGLTAVDRARIEEMRQDTARRARAQEGAIMADAAEQGRAGGNASLLLRNQAQQSATNTRALGDMQTAATGLERKDAAIRNRGFLGGDVQAADDAIDKFNTENAQATLDNNTAAKNRAEAARWGLEEDNKNENVDVIQGAIGVDHDAETVRSDKNADRQYGANVANDQGEQAHYGGRWGSLLNKYGIVQSGPAYDVGDKSTPGSAGSDGLAAGGQGAIGGAAAGSAFGPVGTIGGAAVGFATGFLGGRKKRERGSNGAW